MTLDEFARYVANAVLREDFEEDAGGWAELFCRRLYKLGYIDKKDDCWTLAKKRKEGKE